MPESTIDRPAGNIHRDTALGLSVLAAVTLLLQLVGLSFWLTGFMAIVVFTFLPGAAVVSALPPLNLPARIGLSAAFSFSITAIFAYALICLHIYYPAIILWTLYPISCFVLLRYAAPTGPAGLKKRALTRIELGLEGLRADRTAMIALGVGSAALVLWFIGCLSTDGEGLGGLGLVSALPPTWKIGAFGAVVTAAAYCVSREPIYWVVAALIGLVAGAVYLTPVIVYDIPHLPWNYKHIGVVELLLQLHHTKPNLDIYNRWPSFFGVAGVFTQLGGFSNPVQYVKWAEIYFISIQCVLVSGIALTHDKRYGLAGFATLLFIAIDWIGQVYFAPQAMGFTLMLAVLLLFWQFLYAGGNKLGGILAWLTSFVSRRKQQWDTERVGDWPRELAAGLSLLPMTGIVLVHQLTPYVLLLQLTALTLFGYLRPRWMLFACGAITILYLLPQLGWVNSHFGLFSSLNPLDNAKNVQTETFICTDDCAIVQGAARASTLGAWLLAFISIVVLARRRPTVRLAALAICFMAPFTTLFGQNYGGEASLRVVLFGSAFTALLITLALFSLKPEWLKRGLAVLIAAGLSLGFFVSYFGLEGVEYLTRDDLASASYMAEHAPKDSALISSGFQTVSRHTANYGDFYDKETLASVLGTKYQTSPYSRAVLVDLITAFNTYDDRIFTTFSPRNDSASFQAGQFKEGFMPALHKAMLESGYFKVWKEIGDVQIVEFVPKEKQTPAQRAAARKAAAAL
jgi:hypothetical protein